MKNFKIKLFLTILLVSMLYGQEALSMKSSKLTQTDISMLYVTIFNRASEGDGNRYWQNRGLSIVDTAEKMLDTSVAKEYFGQALDSNQDFIEYIYKNTLNKTVSEDEKGINFWVNRLKTTSRAETIVTLINAINDPKHTGKAQNQFNNRVSVSNYMANTLTKTPSDYKTSTSFGKNLIVTDDENSVQSAKESINVIFNKENNDNEVNRNDEDDDNEDNDNEDNDDEDNDDDENNHNDNNPSTEPTSTPPIDSTPTTQNKSNYMLSAWNDLGMHCMDGKDFSVFSVLPPYNNLHAQIKDKNGGLVTSGIILTYEAVQGTDGKWNTNSLEATNGAYKTNFWDYAKDLFGVTLNPNVGLTGNKTATKTPVAMKFNPSHGWWEAEGIPITPYNDDGTKNYYPMVKVTAKDSSGKVLTSINTVLPVSDEMDCKKCHSSQSISNDAKPFKGWVNNPDSEKDYKFNILRLHDQENLNAVSSNSVALKAKGYNYDNNGLEATANGGTPVLCVACHKSNALPNVGIEIKQFTSAIHSKHANVKDPITGIRLGDSSNRSACYACHPGAETKCLRGAMGDATNSSGQNSMQCQSCHGDMKDVGATHRDGWLDEPNCQACHHDGKRELSAIDPSTNTLRHAVDTQFATTPNTPMQGKSLFRFSKGHGKLQCEACHGSTHAIYPAHEADNIASQTIQGHVGTVGECSACHNRVPNTVTGGPHGMHPVGQSWVSRHEDVAERNSAQCKVCHGADYRGSSLSKTFTNRSFSTEWGTKNFTKGHKVSCYDCHNGPSGD